MKKKSIYVLVTMCIIGLFGPITMVNANNHLSDLLLSPTPQALELQPGDLAIPAIVDLQGCENADKATVDNLLEFLKSQHIAVNTTKDPAMLKISLQIWSPKSKNLAILQRNRAINPAGYLLVVDSKTITPGQIIIEGNDQTGLFYGVQTMKQLFKTNKTKKIPNLRIEDYPKLAARGVIEGFYGTPWTHQARLDQLKFYGETKLNTYIYAPKDDPYHRAKWREPYPAGEMQRMQELIVTAQANKVDFVFAISPGIDMEFTGAGGAADYAALLAKFESLYAMGVRSFAVYYDDIADKSAARQAAVLNRLQHEFVEQKNGVKPLLTVPTEYFTLDMAVDYGQLKPYTQAFSATLAKEIMVMYTGPTVVCRGISAADNEFVKKIYDRKMAIWWNYPVTDYYLGKLALGPIDGLIGEINKYTDYFVMNPMEYAQLSKIALQTGAEYAWNPLAYDASAAWQRAINMQYGSPVAGAMQIFAEHSMRMDYEWAQAGRDDAPQLRQAMDVFWHKVATGQNIEREKLTLAAEFKKMEQAAQQLQKNLPSSILLECQPQLKVFADLARADQIALQMIAAKLTGDQDKYQQLYQQTKNNWLDIAAQNSKISEKVAMKFLEESLLFGEKVAL